MNSKLGTAKRAMIWSSLVVACLLFLAAAIISSVLQTQLPDSMLCNQQQCSTGSLFLKAALTWLLFTPLIGVALLFVALGYDWLVKRLTAAGASAPPWRFNNIPALGDETQNALARERAAREQAEQRAEIALTRDPLTGLANRGRMVHNTALDIEAASARGESVALFFLDFDNFKQLNDRFGHAAGDQFLRLMANRMERMFDCDGCVGRVGGDEFLVLLEDAIDVLVIEDQVRALEADVARPFEMDGVTMHTTLSVGVARYPQDAQDPHMLMRAADRAMYRAKQGGRHRHVFASDT